MTDRSSDWPSRLRIDPTAFIAPGAVVVGEVTLGARSSVWFNTVVRGDTAAITVGADTNLQDNTTVHVDEGMPTIVGARVTVGHRAIVHGCVVEDDCLIGMGAVILSGARIGAGSLVGAAALVREGEVIPPGSLVLGMPAKVVGTVTEAHRSAIASGNAHYVALARSYLTRGIAATLPPASRPHQLPGAGAPMESLEWEQRLEVLRSGPHWGQERFEAHGREAFRRPPAPGRWSAVEVVCHLRDCDREVFVPRLERVLTEDLPAVADLPTQDWARQRGYAEADPEVALAAWRDVREQLMARLAPLGPDAWARPMIHPRRGPHTLADLVRHWSDHDLSHRRQIRAALGDARVIHVFGAPGPPVPRLVAALAARGHALRAGEADRSAGSSALVLGAGATLDPLALAALVGGWQRAEGARLLVLSALGAHPDARAPRLRQLWALEEQARGFGLPVLTLRLAPLVGPASPFWLRLRSGEVPPGRARRLVQPVVESDVVETLDRALAGEAAWEGWYELAGEEPLALDELAGLARAAGPRLPAGAGAWEPPPEELAEHRLAESAPWRSHFGLDPRPLAAQAGAWAA